MILVLNVKSAFRNASLEHIFVSHSLCILQLAFCLLVNVPITSSIRDPDTPYGLSLDMRLPRLVASNALEQSV